MPCNVKFSDADVSPYPRIRAEPPSPLDRHTKSQYRTSIFGCQQVALIHCHEHVCKHAMILGCVMQLYEELYWQNYDTMESNRIELAKQARREALQAAEAANRAEEDLELPAELQQGSGFFPNLGKVTVIYKRSSHVP